MDSKKIEVDEIEICYDGTGRKWVTINGQKSLATSEATVNFVKDPLAEVTITFVTDQVRVTRVEDVPGDGVDA